MRQRRVTGIEERLAPYADLILQGHNGDVSIMSQQQDIIETSPLCPGGPPSHYARWYQRSSPRYLLPEGFGRVYAELGCGRGLFINTMAAEDPEGLYIGVEGCKTIVIRGLQKTREAGLKNVRYIDGFINDATAAFGEGTLAGLFLNFSDPWPKERHTDRRLTAPAKAEAYLRALAQGGFVSFKTDGEALFRYSLASFTDAGFTIAGAACDIATAVHERKIAERAASTPTEYELKFRALGRPIYQFTAVRN